MTTTDLFWGLATATDLMLDRCEELRDPKYLQLSLSVVIVLGILVSYLPQHYRIIARGTSEGISPYFILLGTTSGTCALANILALPASRADVACCSTISPFECAAALLGIVQMSVQWFCFTVILFLFLVFFPRASTSVVDTDEQQYTWRTALTVGFLCLLHGLVILIVSVTLVLARPTYLELWAVALGIFGTVLAAIQYLPQIWMTYHLGHVGSLSIPMMLIQTPGSFVWSASLAARYGIAGWSSWGLFLVTGSLQGCLLVMGISFELKARRAKQSEEGENSNGTCVVGYIPSERANAETDDEGGAVVEAGMNETTPLITGSRNKSRKLGPS